MGVPVTFYLPGIVVPVPAARYPTKMRCQVADNPGIVATAASRGAAVAGEGILLNDGVSDGWDCIQRKINLLHGQGVVQRVRVVGEWGEGEEGVLVNDRVSDWVGLYLKKNKPLALSGRCSLCWGSDSSEWHI